jgi:coenzyme F420 hydrogenase subunit beta
VGTPCQIKAIRKMQAMQIVPSESIVFCLGLFCSGNFVMGERQREKLAELGGFSWDDVRKINIKDAFQVHLTSGDIRTIPLEQLDFMKREACRFCADYSAEYADLSFGGLGAQEGWTTVLTRTPKGRAAFVEAMESAVEGAAWKNGHSASYAFEQVLDWSRRKKQLAQENRSQLGKPSVRFKTT